MVWGKMHGEWHKERAVAELRRVDRDGLPALGLHAVIMSWCLDQPALDGFVPDYELSTRERKHARKLVEKGLWEAAPGGYKLVNWVKIAPSLESLERKREADREREAAKRQQNLPGIACEPRASRVRVARVDQDLDQTEKKKQNPLSMQGSRSRVAAAGAAPEEREGGDRFESGEQTEKGAQAPREGAGASRASADAAAPLAGPSRPPPAPAPVLAEDHRHRTAARAAWGTLEDLQLEVVDELPAANTNARLGEPPPGFDEPDLFALAAQVWNRFRALYDERFGHLPQMNAKNAGDFAERLASIARKLGEEPMALLERAFDAWALRPPKEEVGRQYPYANFVARFEALVMQRPSGASERDKLEKRISAALVKGDHDGYEALNEQYRKQYGGSRARPN